MRLICPSCETEYEVHENMIPAEGRDVQCSSCMKTWFQSGPTNAAPEIADDLKIDRNAPASESDAAETPSDPRPKPPAAPQSSDYDDDGDEDLSSLPPAAIAAMSGKKPSSPKIDDDALGVIRDEVVREQSARKSEAGTIETQIDLGIDEADTGTPAKATQDQVATDAAEIVEDADADLEAALTDVDETITEHAAKSDRLPDIEEINSTLSDAPEYDDFEDDMDAAPARHPKARNRSGFRLGFGMMLLLAAALVGIYVYANPLSNSIPALAGFLEGYVNTIDGLRVWLDRSAQDLVDQITKLLGTVG